MPTSKKRKKKQKEEAKPVVNRNIVKTRWGRIVIVILALGFVLSGVIGLIYVLIQAMQR
jgi:lipid-binding SYLF domain-containing protein